MFYILIFLGVAEARVFCADSNAMPWVATGSSCPVLCASVQDAIERLIILDYRKSIQEQFGHNKQSKFLVEEYLDETLLIQRQNLRKNSIDNNESKTKNKKPLKDKNLDVNANEIFKTFKNAEDILRPNRKLLQNTTKIAQNFKNPQNARDILRPSKYLVENITNVDQDYDKGKKKCWYLEKYKPKLLLGKVVRRECSRRSNFDSNFLTIMTNVLNEYADTMFKFTEEMTEMLLDNIFGQNTDLRNNILDVNKLLKYLRKSVNLHKSHSHVITLKSRHCLTLSVPGCYCKPGFVESSGQCVRPADCITDENYIKYLKRIIIA